MVYPFGDEGTKPVSEVLIGNVVFSYDQNHDDLGRRGWFMLKEWAEAVGCEDFGDWVLTTGEKTLLRSCDVEQCF